MVYFRRFLEAPIPLLVLDCGSISTSNTLRPEAARYVARLMAVVVFPTPPFWFVIAYTFDTGYNRTFHLTIAGCNTSCLQTVSKRYCNQLWSDERYGCNLCRKYMQSRTRRGE